jgi:hypothetical protein
MAADAFFARFAAHMEQSHDQLLRRHVLLVMLVEEVTGTGAATHEDVLERLRFATAPATLGTLARRLERCRARPLVFAGHG